MSAADKQPSNGKPDDIHSDPAKMPLWDILRSLNTGQFYALVLFAAGLFGAGFGIGQWAAVINHDRELAQMESGHRDEVRNKDSIIEERDRAILELEESLETANQTGKEAMGVAAAADRAARAHRAKAEFLHRYLSYLEDPNPNGAMHKLFVDHVCVLWRETQRDIHSIESDTITLQDISRGRPLTTEAMEAFSAIGISPSTIEEYRRLDQKRAQLRPRASRSPVISRAPDSSRVTQFSRLQRLEQQLHGAIKDGVTTKTVTFFDGTRYRIPQPVANDVHLRGDCLS